VEGVAQSLVHDLWPGRTVTVLSQDKENSTFRISTNGVRYVLYFETPNQPEGTDNWYQVSPGKRVETMRVLNDSSRLDLRL
jgi:hypothetical protein